MTGGLLSCGYQSRTAAEVVAGLVANHVDVLADVRLTPMSRTRGLTQRAFATLLDEQGIAYRHFPSLGNPKANRAGFARQDPAAAQTFRALMSSAQADADLEALVALSRDLRVAVLCFEESEEHCHRRLVLDELVRRGARRV